MRQNNQENKWNSGSFETMLLARGILFIGHMSERGGARPKAIRQSDGYAGD